ncbi:MAG: ArsI/CadI family heavy metal resistance metalloenzyme [Bacteroidota bacterium]
MRTNPFPKMHVSYYVSDIEATIDFYNRFFNKSADKVKENYAKYELDQPALVISFIENKSAIKPNFGHLGFQVQTVEALEGKRKALIDQEVEIGLEEKGTACCYAVQDKFWVSDPDNYRWEVYYFHEDSEFNDPNYELKSDGSCCVPSASAEECCEQPCGCS